MSKLGTLKNFSKEMTVPEIKEIASYNSSVLWDLINFLNQDGKDLHDTYDIIEFEATFSDTIDDLAKGIEDHINDPKRIHHKANKDVVKNLKNFCKNILGKVITIKEERS